jgi:hypothetical protein
MKFLVLLPNGSFKNPAKLFSGIMLYTISFCCFLLYYLFKGFKIFAVENAAPVSKRQCGKSRLVSAVEKEIRSTPN